MGETHMPLARERELVVEQLDGETLIYDLRSDNAHCLDHEAAIIWQACDGERSPEEIATETGLNLVAVTATIDTLHANRLVQNNDGVSRRRMLHTLAIGAGVGVSLPVIKSIVAPTAAQAVSCKGPGVSCSASAECCSGVCSSNLCT